MRIPRFLSNLIYAFKHGRKKRRETVCLFTRQIQFLLASGIPVIRALSILSEQAEDKDFQKSLLLLRQDLESGMDLAKAFGRHPRYFTPFYVAMVDAMAVSGQTKEISEALAEQLEADRALQQKIGAATTYPILVLGVTLLLTFAIFHFILPPFLSLIQGLQVPLPFPTRILIAVNKVFGSRIGMAVILLLLGGGGVYAFSWSKTPEGKEILETIKFSMPYIGKLNQKIVITQTFQLLSLMVRVGIPIPTALKIAAQVAGDGSFSRALQKIRQNLALGETLSKSFAEFPEFRVGNVEEFLLVAEETGNFHGMMAKISKVLSEDITLGFLRLTGILEPLLIGFMGIVVGFIIVALFLPIYSVINHLG